MGLTSMFVRNTDQISGIVRPIPDGASADEPLGQLLRDLLWSDPTDSDTILGIHESARGNGIALFGPDRVKEFCQANDLDVIIRSHQVVEAGYEFFAGQQLITVFSATDYCGQHKNDGAILEIDRDLVITPKTVRCRTSRWAVSRDSSPPRGFVHPGN
jgi:putative ubiquitin-RnfH superfamily antitoxin RatB of RatAB toxin-antitoxin module